MELVAYSYEPSQIKDLERHFLEVGLARVIHEERPPFGRLYTRNVVRSSVSPGRLPVG